jgi:hypothetical protein
LNSFALMYDGDNQGGDSFGVGATWTVQIARYDNELSNGYAERENEAGDGPEDSGPSSQFGTNPLVSQLYIGIMTIAEPDVGDWVSMIFTDDDLLTLEGGHTYALQLGSDIGWSRWASGDADTIADAERFRPFGGSVGGDNYVDQQSPNDRTIVIELNAVPEPSVALLGGLSLLGLLRRRRC